MQPAEHEREIQIVEAWRVMITSSTTRMITKWTNKYSSSVKLLCGIFGYNAISSDTWKFFIYHISYFSPMFTYYNLKMLSSIF